MGSTEQRANMDAEPEPMALSLAPEEILTQALIKVEPQTRGLYGRTFYGYAEDIIAALAALDYSLVRTSTLDKHNPPEDGDDQRRCWTVGMFANGDAQCWLHNGHEGECQFGPPARLAHIVVPERHSEASPPSASTDTPDERYRTGWCCDFDFDNGTYRTTPECISRTRDADAVEGKHRETLTYWRDVLNRGVLEGREREHSLFVSKAIDDALMAEDR